VVTERHSGDEALKGGWRRVSLRARGVSVLAFPLAVLFVTLFAIYWAENAVYRAEETVGRYYETRGAIVQLGSAVSDAEAAVGGYTATGFSRFHDAFQTARASAAAALQSLPRLTGDQAATRAAAADIERLGALELASLDARAAGGSRPAGNLVADLQARLALLAGEEERRFTQARYERDLARRNLFRTVLACGILGPMGALLIHLLVAGRLVKRIEKVTENARRLAHGLPLEPFPGGTDEIAALARQLQDAATLLQERERELRGSETRYRDLFDQAPVPFEETDSNGVVTRFNQAVCALLRCAPARLTGHYAWDFVPSDEQEGFRSAMLGRIASGASAAPFETEFVLDDGSRLSVEIRESPIRDENGQIAGLCLSLLDITERNLAAVAARKVEQYALELRNKNEQLGRALEAAHSATEAKSRFLASISHELRTPLNGIIGFSELMHDGRLGPILPEQVDVMADILTSARHLLQLINDILDLSKIEAGKMEFRPEDCDLGALIQEVMDVMAPLAEKKSLAIDTRVPTGVHASLDPARFKQVLYNYVSNAVKFTPQGGNVSVRISYHEPDRFQLEVADTGIGIPESEIPRLFQEFQQLPNSRKAEQGTGLGLALTRAIVEAQGGRVGVRSEPGRGSVFSAILPLHGNAAASVNG